MKKCWGLMGRILSPKTLPYTYMVYAHVEGLWLDPTLRRSGLGTIVLNQTKRYLHQQGVDLIELDTSDFQATEFYKKNGFRVSPVYKDLFRTKEGTFATNYTCQIALGD